MTAVASEERMNGGVESDWGIPVCGMKLEACNADKSDQSKGCVPVWRQSIEKPAEQRGNLDHSGDRHRVIVLPQKQDGWPPPSQAEGMLSRHDALLSK